MEDRADPAVGGDLPGGESMPRCRPAAVDAATTAAFEKEHTDRAVWVAVSHGDVIKSVLADAWACTSTCSSVIIVDPASVSIVRYTRCASVRPG